MGKQDNRLPCALGILYLYTVMYTSKLYVNKIEMDKLLY